MSWFFPSGGQSIEDSAFSISPSNEYSELIFFRMDWLDLLAVQGTLKSLLQHNSKVSVLQCSTFFIVQLSHLYMTTGKTIALTKWTFVAKVMSLLFNMLSRLVITFLSGSKSLLISWLQSPSTVILEPPKINTVSTVSPSLFHEVMEQRLRGTRVVERSYPMSKIRSGQEELPHVQSQEWWLRGLPTRPRSGAVAKRRYPTSKVRSISHEELPHIQGKEQRLCFAGAAVKRYPTSKVRETQVRR